MSISEILKAISSKGYDLEELLQRNIDQEEVKRINSLPIADVIIAAQEGDPMAQFRIGCHYEFGDVGIFQKSDEKAFEWYSKAATQGIFGARYNQACAYYAGKGISQSYETAFLLFLKLAEETENPACQFQVGAAYWNGEGIKRCPKTGFEWIKKSALGGDRKAQVHLMMILAKHIELNNGDRND